jgi:hypothetical protein
VNSAGPITLKRATIVGLLALCLTSGCGSLSVAVPWKKMPLDASAGFYESASIVYRLDAGKMEQPLDVARVEGQKILFEQVASSPLADQSIGTLTVTFPHPGGRPGLAQAKFAIDSIPGKAPKPAATRRWNPLSRKPPGPPAPTSLVTSQPEVHEMWVLDIPAAESDQYFKLLAAQSFYNTERPGTGAAQLTVTINGSQVRKPWEQVPQFGALAQRVRRDGRLVAYSRPAAQAGTAEGAIASLGVYRNLLAQTSSPEAIAAATASLAANPFSMPPVTMPPVTVPQFSPQGSAVAGAPGSPPRR